MKVLLLITGFVIGFTINNKPSNDEFKIIRKIDTQTKFVYKSIPEDLPTLKSCYSSRIKIKTSVNRDWLNIIAKDKCKSAQANIQLAQNNNYKYYFAISTAAVLGAVLIYKL